MNRSGLLWKEPLHSKSFLRSGTPLKSRIRLVSKTPPRRYTRLRRSGEPKPTRVRAAVRPATRREIRTRSGGMCEPAVVGVCVGRAVETSHRLHRKMGGRHGAARQRSELLSNVMDSCRPCNRWIEDEPAEALRLGLRLEEWQDPALEPVVYRGEPSYLDNLGGVHSAEAVGA